MKKVIIRVGTILILITGGVLLCFTGMISKAETTSTVYDGVYIEDMPIGGMTKESVEETVTSYANEILNKTISLKTKDGESVITSLKNLGVTWINPEIIEEAYMYGRKGNLIERYKLVQDLKDTTVNFTLMFSVDDDMVEEFIVDNFTTFETEPMDAIFTRVDGKNVITPEENGKELNVELSMHSVKEELEANLKGELQPCEIYFDEIKAKGTEEEFSKMVDVLGTFTTSYSTSSSNRSGNVVNGASKIDGTFLYPGETISVYEKCEPFTYENGYFDAGAYSDGLVIDSIGGGICQVTTTLYNAAIRSELEIVERHPHSMVVTYVNLSADSALSGTYKDLKFMNNTEHPIYIEGITTQDKHLTFTIYGIEERPENREIAFYSEKISETVPTTERIVQDATFGLGYLNTQGVHIGYTAKLWKIIKVDGVETERVLVNESKYIPSSRTLIVGTAGASPEILEAISAAAATGSIEAVKTTVSTILATPAP
jgi:vancomycin resistance protein YoaR